MCSEIKNDFNGMRMHGSFSKHYVRSEQRVSSMETTTSNIKTVFPSYGDIHYKDKSVGIAIREIRHLYHCISIPTLLYCYI